MSDFYANANSLLKLPRSESSSPSPPSSPRSETDSDSSSLAERSGSDSPPPTLDPNTLALLHSFLAEKAVQERKFEEFVVGADLALGGEEGEGGGFRVEPGKEGTNGNKNGNGNGNGKQNGKGRKAGPIRLPDYFTAFGEDWQLSQFWYTEEFTNELAKALYDLCVSIVSERSSSDGAPDGNTVNVAFLCAPTAFVGFQRYLYELGISTSEPKPTPNLKVNINLLEYDARFSHVVYNPPSLAPASLVPTSPGPTSPTSSASPHAVLSSSQYTPYDIHTPLALPAHLAGGYDIVLADPPFLNEETNVKIRRSVGGLVRPGGGGLVKPAGGGLVKPGVGGAGAGAGAGAIRNERGGRGVPVNEPQPQPELQPERQSKFGAQAEAQASDTDGTAAPAPATPNPQSESNSERGRGGGKMVLITSLSTLPFLDRVYTRKGDVGIGVGGGVAGGTATDATDEGGDAGDATAADATSSDATSSDATGGGGVGEYAVDADEDQADSDGDPHLGPLYRCTHIHVTHHKLAHDFACWGNWEGAVGFGA